MHPKTSVAPADNPRRGLYRLTLPTLALLFFFGILSTRFAHDGDIFWHIATGRWILETGVFPQTDPFSFSVPGAPWIPHEWLAAILFAVAFDGTGWPGVLALTAFSAALAYAIILRLLLARMQPLYAVPLTALAFFLSLHHFLLRPHVLAMPLLVYWVGRLVDAADRGGRPPSHLLGVLWIWANLHGSFTFGLLMAAALAIDAVLRTPGGVSRAAACRHWARFLGLALMVSLATPYGYKGLLFPALLYGHPYLLDMISEWQSPDFHDPQALEVWLLLFIAYALLSGLRVPTLRLLLVLALIHMALHHIRHVALLGMLSPLLLADSLVRQGADKALGHHGPRSFNAFCERFAQRGSKSSAGLSVAIFALLIGATYLRDPAPSGRLGIFKGIEVVKQHGIHGHVLNNPGFGGPLIFMGIPPFIDGRLDLYGEDFLKRYIRAINLMDRHALRDLLERYAIDWAVFDPGRPLVTLLDLNGHWRRIYEDRFVVVQVNCSRFVSLKVCSDPSYLGHDRAMPGEQRH